MRLSGGETIVYAVVFWLSFFRFHFLAAASKWTDEVRISAFRLFAKFEDVY